MEVRSFEAGFKRYLVQATEEGMAAVAAFLVPRLRHVVGIHNPTHKSGVRYKRPSKSGAKTHTTFAHGAPPGGPPYHRTGVGQQSIQSQMLDSGKRLIIGVRPQGKYMLYLDRGIKYPTHGQGAGQGRELCWPWAESTVLISLDTCRKLFMTGAR